MKTVIANPSAQAATRELRGAMQGRVVVKGDDSYHQVRGIWNGAIDHEPALFAICETVTDVQSAVRTARAHDLPLSVRAGGHDLFGRALRHDGLVIDLTAMRQVEVNGAAKVATVAGGVIGSLRDPIAHLLTRLTMVAPDLGPAAPSYTGVALGNSDVSSFEEVKVLRPAAFSAGNCADELN